MSSPREQESSRGARPGPLVAGWRRLAAWAAPAARHCPTTCRICGAWQQAPICSACVSDCAPATRRCIRCALRMPCDTPRGPPRAGGDAVGIACDRCRLRPPSLWRCFAAVDYAEPWSACITAFKFGNDPGLAAPLARLLASAPGVDEALSTIELLLPVPLSDARLASRGYNQAFELARRLRPDAVSATTLLRIRDTPAQSGQALAERWRNLRGAFAIEPSHRPRLEGTEVALVDDVMTSGASLHACAQVLRDAGATRVSAFVLARTPEPT